jgi:hypothetical protein
MPAIFVLFSVVAAACLAVFVLRLSTDHADWSKDRREHFVGSGTWSPAGGVAGRASWPLVRLEILPSGIVVGPTSRWLQWAVPRVAMQWADISCVESCPTGIRINFKGTSDRALLFQLHRDAVLDALRRYPIELRV